MRAGHPSGHGAIGQGLDEHEDEGGGGAGRGACGIHQPFGNDDGPAEAFHEPQAERFAGFRCAGPRYDGGAPGVHEGRGVRHAANEPHGGNVAVEKARDALECETGGDGDNQGVFAHCVADLGDHFREELRLHSEHQHIGRFGNLAVAGSDGDAELLGALLPRGLGFSRADDVGGGDHSRVAVFAAERCVLAQQASDNGRGHVS